MRFNSDKKFKAWKDVKEGDIICYYDKGKIHNQIVTSVEEKEEINTYSWGFTTTTTRHKYLIIKAGRGSEIKIYEHYRNLPFYEDYYFTRFTCNEACIECLKQHFNKLQVKAERAKAKYEKFLNITNKYNKVISDYNEILHILN